MSTINSLIFNDLLVCQPDSGFRFTSDSVYLSWFTRSFINKKYIDIGSGSGVISALLVRLKRAGVIDAIEMQNEMIKCLRETLSLSNIHNSVSVIEGDIRTYRPDFQYDGAVCNPPYRDPSSGHLPEDETGLNARFTTTMKAEDVFSFCRSFLKFGSPLYMSYDADMMPVLFEAAFRYGFEAKRLMPVCPDVHIKPKIILIEFRKGGKRELSFEPPLFIKINGQETELHKKIFNGDW